MPALPSFHEVRFPTDIALGSTGGPRRRTEIVILGSGKEQRNARWAFSRRHYNAGYGVKTLDDLAVVIEFFEQRRGRLFGFRFRDPLDNKSCSPAEQVSPIDQKIGTGDGQMAVFQLVKSYGDGEGSYERPVIKPVEGTVQVSVEGMVKSEGQDFEVDYTTGEITFLPPSIPLLNDAIYAGFEFDLPVRFDTDEITVNMSSFLAGDIASIPLMEILQ